MTSWTGTSQEKFSGSFLDVNYFAGSILLHKKDILPLIKGHPEGFILGWSHRTSGTEAWQKRYNYPDYGVSFSYENLKNPELGNVLSLYAHYNFYFFRRHVMFRVGQGIGHTNAPYDKVKNYRNIAFGSHFMSSTLLMLNYKKEALWRDLGWQIGLTFLHYSNGNTKAPNAGINSLTFNIGVNYRLDNAPRNYQAQEQANFSKYQERIKYNLAFRAGLNESDIVGSGQFPFYTLSAYADKRLSYKSAIQLGADLFFSKSLKEYIHYKNTTPFTPTTNTGTSTDDADYKRLGIVVGHELFVNKLSLLTQIGYYVYYPFDSEGRTYFRVGLKRYFFKKYFVAATLKSHGARAEALEYTLGIRL